MKLCVLLLVATLGLACTAQKPPTVCPNETVAKENECIILYNRVIDAVVALHPDFPQMNSLDVSIYRTALSRKLSAAGTSRDFYVHCIAEASSDELQCLQTASDFDAMYSCSPVSFGALRKMESVRVPQ